MCLFTQTVLTKRYSDKAEVCLFVNKRITCQVEYKTKENSQNIIALRKKLDRCKLLTLGPSP